MSRAESVLSAVDSGIGVVLIAIAATAALLGLHPSAVYAGSARRAVAARRVAMVACLRCGMGQRAVGRAFGLDRKCVARALEVVSPDEGLDAAASAVVASMRSQGAAQGLPGVPG